MRGLPHRRKLNVIDSSRCLLAEAFGFTEYYHKCKTCEMMPYGVTPEHPPREKFESLCHIAQKRFSDEELDEHPTIKRFIDHMESKHPQRCKWL